MARDASGVEKSVPCRAELRTDADGEAVRFPDSKGVATRDVLIW